MKKFSTPMMQQYGKIKEQYKDCLLFYRMGDFYELFLEDAHIGAKILNITLTSKAGGKDGRVPMAGVPYHAVDSYLSKLVKAGYKVAICEQVSLPNKYGLVDREVVRIVTPGTVLDEKFLDKKENNYIVSLDIDGETLALSFADLSTGYFGTYEVDYTTPSNGSIQNTMPGKSDESNAYESLRDILRNELSKLSPVECILHEELYNDPEFLKLLKSDRNINIFPFSEWNNFSDNAATFLKNHFSIATLEIFDLNETNLCLQTSAVLLGYLEHTQKTRVNHIKKISKVESSEFVVMDRSTMINLELFSTIREHDIYGTLISVLDQTITPMGGRLLKSWMKKPLVDKNGIEKRFDAVSYLLENCSLREELKKLLCEIPDIERILSRLSVNIGNARDLINLKLALEACLKVKEQLDPSPQPSPLKGFKFNIQTNKEENKKKFLLPSNSIPSPFQREKVRMRVLNSVELLNQISTGISSELQHVIDLIEKNIQNEPPIDLKIGGLIKDGIHDELDKLRKIVGGSRDWILELEKQERKKTGISSLKIRYNKIFGFYIEVSKSYLHLVPKNYNRKQTLVNGERFITPELKHHEEIILTAEERMKNLEYDLYMKILEKVLGHISDIQESAENIGILDCVLNFSDLAEKENYVRPKLLYSGEMKITQGRHPVVEKLLEDSQFVPNDVMLDNISQSLLLITGPNMAGKSVFIRKVALIVLMAQMGCFVPAQKAYISIVDRIFVRSGASDVITSGLSTFMVEMVETAHILHHATKNSLIVMDEIGRGTSTYDGISIAWAVAEYLATHFKTSPKTLFATHYHELQELEKQYPEKIKNYHMAVADDGGKPVFLHTILPGGASHSFGVAVAKLAGVPEAVIEKAEEMLIQLEERSNNTRHTDASSRHPELLSESPEETEILKRVQHGNFNFADHLIHKELENIDISQTTPLEALNKLAELKEKMKILEESDEKILEMD